jgi:hypothetical protein
MSYRLSSIGKKNESPVSVRDDTLLLQLTELNTHTKNFMANTQSHNADMCDLMWRMVHKQDKMLQAHRKLLEAINRQQQFPNGAERQFRHRPLDRRMGNSSLRTKTEVEEAESQRQLRPKLEVEEQSFR